MSLFSISKRGLALICVLVTALWGLIAAEQRIQRKIDLEYQQIYRSPPSAKDLPGHSTAGLPALRAVI